MHFTSTRLKIVLFGAALALVAVGCSSSSKTTDAGGTTTTTAKAQPETTSPPATVAVAKTSIGSVLVDSKGMTIYLFTVDKGTTSSCTGGCLQEWPPVVATGTPTPGTGVTATLSTAAQADGTKQLVVNGHLVYTFANDKAAGDTMGQGVGKVWYALTPSGDAVGAPAA
jgi:predicted lipoprotein with Yx(FWY)xxD motif